MSKLTAAIEGIGLLGPGMADWPAGQAILAGRAEYVHRAVVAPVPAALPPAERRRSSSVVKLALAVGHEAVAAAGLDPALLPTVFASSSGDGHNCHAICEALAAAERVISPTRFHNSVNNAAAGYWSIATRAMAPSSVLCGFDASFGAGLLDAMTQVATDASRCLLIAYDTEYPQPLSKLRPIAGSFGVALALAPVGSGQSLGEISVAFTGQAPDRLADAALEALRLTLPAARCLPLLQAIAGGTETRVVLEYLSPLQLAVEVAPWH